jgi:hypothetical protein
VEDKDKEEVEDVAGWAAAAPAQEEHAFAHLAASVSLTIWESPATRYHAHPAVKK